jgi:hypothetical protein
VPRNGAIGMTGALIALGVVALVGFGIMWCNFVERPSNDSGADGSFISGTRPRDYNPSLPPENEKQLRRMRKWWEW